VDIIERDVASQRSFTIAEWCSARRISRSSYYNLKRAGLGPAELRIGVKVTITPEADAAWRKQMQTRTADAGRGDDLVQAEAK
jgi:hypothetical protein